MERGNHVPVTVGSYLIRIGLGPGTDYILNRTFVTGRTGSFEKVFEKGQRSFLHQVLRENILAI
jgi:hypothetical protein